MILAPVIAAATAAPAAALHEIDNFYPTIGAPHPYKPLCTNTQFENAPNTVFCQTDNPKLTYYTETSLHPDARTRVQSVLNTQWNTLPFTVTRHTSSTVKYGGPAETDIIFQQGGGIPGSDDGYTWCNGAADTKHCDQHYNRFASSNPGGGLICHEAGHASGLVHGFNSRPELDNQDNRLGCMQKFVPASNTGQLGAVNRHNLADAYGPGGVASAAGVPFPSYKE